MNINIYFITNLKWIFLQKLFKFINYILSRIFNAFFTTKCDIFVFVKADMQSRIERAVKYYDIPEEKAEDTIRKADRRRASYYSYYATGTWGDVANYDMCVDTGDIGVEGAVELMAKFVELHESSRGHE